MVTLWMLLFLDVAQKGIDEAASNVTCQLIRGNPTDDFICM